jgi:hypothetical protein
LTFGPSGQYESCGKYSNLYPCQILHFSEVSKYFSYFYSLLLVYSIGKGFKLEKISVGRFLYGRPSSAPTPAHLHVRASLPARYCTTVAVRRGPPVGVVFPQILPGCALAGIAAAIPVAASSTRHHPIIVRIPTCVPATLSRRIGYGASWCPITAARLRLPSSPLRRSNSRADRSVMKSSSRPLRWPSFRC